jgi:hypothetical protein
MVSLEFFIDIILPAALMALGLTQPLTEMSTRNISWGVKTDNLTTYVPTVLKFGSLNLLEPYGPVMGLLYLYLCTYVLYIHIMRNVHTKVVDKMK